MIEMQELLVETPGVTNEVVFCIETANLVSRFQQAKQCGESYSSTGAGQSSDPDVNLH